MKAVKKVSYVLKKSLRKRGEAGDVISVARGFGRYLESQSIAERATEEVLKNLEANKKAWMMQEEVSVRAAKALIEKVKGMTVVLKRRVAQGEKLYESVRPEVIVAAFKEQGISLVNDNIKLNTQIKKLGKHPVIIHAYGNYETEVTLEIISDALDTI